jgi:hypothetical protein
MKLTALFVLSLLPLFSSAQSLTAGIHGGVLYNTAPERATSTAVKPYGSLRVYKEVNSVTLGFGLDAGSLDANTTIQYIDSVSKTVEHFAYTQQYARHFIMPNISVNVKMPVLRSHWYFGGNIGYMFGKTTYMETPTLYSLTKRIEATSGASIGAHAGFILNAGKNMGFSLEVAGRYVSIGKSRASLFYFPLSAGLQYYIR